MSAKRTHWGHLLSGAAFETTRTRVVFRMDQKPPQEPLPNREPS